MNDASEQSDEQLLRDFHCGRQEALADLAGRYETALLGLAVGLLGGRPDLACDAVQETWVRVIRFGRQYAGRASVKTWLYTRPADETPPPPKPELTLVRHFSDSVSAAWHRGLRFLANTLAGLVAIIVGGAVWWAILIAALVLYRARMRQRATRTKLE